MLPRPLANSTTTGIISCYLYYTVEDTSIWKAKLNHPIPAIRYLIQHFDSQAHPTQ